MRMSNDFFNLLKVAGLEDVLDEIAEKDSDSIKHRECTDYLCVNGELITYIDKKKINYEDSVEIKDMSLISRFSSYQTNETYVKNRKSIKPGRLFRRILGRDLKSTEIESILSVLKSSDYYIEVVSGEDIRKYYHEDNYASDCGSLNSSCMRYDECQEYLNIYVENTKMAVLRKRGEEETDLIYGRAILWDGAKLIQKDSQITKEVNVMDRIYSCTTKTKIFTGWAKLNNYCYKVSQNSCNQSFVYDGKVIETGYNDDYIIIFDKIKESYTTYPYVDTLYNMSPCKKSVATSSEYGHYDKDLQDADGNNEGEVCEYCGDREEYGDDGAYVENYGWICNHCLDEHFVYCVDSQDYERVDDAYWCEDCGDAYSYDGNVIRLDDIDIIICEHCAEKDNVFTTEDGYTVSGNCQVYDVIYRDFTYSFYKENNALTFKSNNEGAVLDNDYQ